MPTPAWSVNVVRNGGGLDVRAGETGSYTTTLSTGQMVDSQVTVRAISPTLVH